MVEDFDIMSDGEKINIRTVKSKKLGYLFIYTYQKEKRIFNVYDLLAVAYKSKDEKFAEQLILLLDEFAPESSLYWYLREAVMISKIAIKEREERVSKSQKCKTYLMIDKNTGFTKIGKSIRPSKREYTLQSEKPTITLFKVCDKLVERELHNLFSSKRIRGKWYDLSDKDIKYILEKYNFK